jgi:hypothetical protein
MNGPDALGVAPALALHFTCGFALPGSDSLGQLRGQIKIAMHAFPIGAAKSKQRLGMSHIDSVFQLGSPGGNRAFEKEELNLQRLQLWKFIRHAQGFFDFLTLLLAVFGSNSCSWIIHSYKLGAIDWR